MKKDRLFSIQRISFVVVILEHSPDGPDWRDVVFASRTWLGLKNHPDPRHDRILTSLHSLKLSKDISQVTPVN